MANMVYRPLISAPLTLVFSSKNFFWTIDTGIFIISSETLYNQDEYQALYITKSIALKSVTKKRYVSVEK